MKTPAHRPAQGVPPCPGGTGDAMPDHRGPHPLGGTRSLPVPLGFLTRPPISDCPRLVSRSPHKLRRPRRRPSPSAPGLCIPAALHSQPVTAPCRSACSLLRLPAQPRGRLHQPSYNKCRQSPSRRCRFQGTNGTGGGAPLLWWACCWLWTKQSHGQT